jgi:RHS repeat-associated protein
MSMTVAGQPQVTYTYDNGGRLTAIAQGTQSATLAYDGADRRTTLVLPNGVSASYGYDSASQLTSLSYAKSNLTNLGTLYYTYDAAGRRTSVSGTLANTGLPTPVPSAAYDAANELTHWGGSVISYDANGNMTNDGSKTYQWNARNQLASVSGSAALAYDGLGRRTQSATGTTVLYDGLSVVQEKVGGNITSNLLRAPWIDEILARGDSSGTYSFITDALGSTLSLTDGTGQVATTYTYDPFGNTISNGSENQSAQYTARGNDGNGLYYYRARYYDPTIQRFISEDPIGFASKDIDLYSYVGNGPVDFTDPFGYARKPGKTAPSRWPALPPDVCGKKPKWNPEGYWEGNGRRATWDDRSHGAGIDRGNGPQGGHWDDENSNNRWDQDGRLLPGSSNFVIANPSPPTVDPATAKGVAAGLGIGGTIWLIIEYGWPTLLL